MCVCVYVWLYICMCMCERENERAEDEMVATLLHFLCVCVCVCVVCMCLCLCVCVYDRARERERKRKNEREGKRDKDEMPTTFPQILCVIACVCIMCVWGRESECVRERRQAFCVGVCVCVRERERESTRERDDSLWHLGRQERVSFVNFAQAVEHFGQLRGIEGLQRQFHHRLGLVLQRPEDACLQFHTRCVKKETEEYIHI